MHVRFKHTAPTPWILPNVPPTGKTVEVIMVSIVSLRGGKIFHEHVYWDQASVLVQVGLLDPNVVPPGAGVKRLPVVGREAARRMLRGGEKGEADNELLVGGDDSEEEHAEQKVEEAVREDKEKDVDAKEDVKDDTAEKED